jgi:hypothetical protein
MSQKELEIVLTATGPLLAKGPVECRGWGDGGQDLCVSGPIANILVSRNGQSEFSLRILGDGRLIFTNYRGLYETTVTPNLMLRPDRPWETANAEVSDVTPTGA